MDNNLFILDQLRYIISLLVAELIFLLNAVPKRKCILLRACLAYGLCLVAALAYVPMSMWLSGTNNHMTIGTISTIYWLVMTYLTCAAQWFCFETGMCNILFRCIAAFALECISTTILRSLIVNMWLPWLPEQQTVLYIMLAICVYTGIYFIGYRLVAQALQRGTHVGIPEDKKTFLTYFLINTSYSLLICLSKGICEWLLAPINTEQLHTIHVTVQYFGILVMLLASTVMLLMLYHLYEIGTLRTERSLLGHLMAQKAAQYERSKESIDAINQKCHDLKHLLLALQVADDTERRAMLDETQKAVMFYDVAVKTDNEVLDTILTEKSTICAIHNIRLSCTVNTQNMSKIGVVDLYTMLGNAIDNAIECVQNFSDDDKKTISLSIQEKGQMIFITVENYYETAIRMQGAYPMTSKEDAQNHGIGLKSIDMVARRYGGSIQVTTENHVFLLQIMLPIPK